MTYPIPTAALDDRLGFVGTSGSGKTYAAGTAVERLSAGFRRTSSTWRAYKSRLTQAGLIEKRDGRFFATDAGARAIGDVETPPPPGRELARWWAARLSGTPPIVERLILAYPGAIARDELALDVGLSPTSSTYRAYLSRLAGPGLIERSGGNVALAREVME